MARLDRRLTKALSSTLLCCFALGTGLGAQTSYPQNGVTAAQGYPISTLTPGTDYIWADSTHARWKVSNGGVGGASGLDLAIWPCGGAQGGIVYSGSPAVSSVYPETCLPYPSTVDAGVPLLEGSAYPQWGSENLNLQTYSVVSEVPVRPQAQPTPKPRTTSQVPPGSTFSASNSRTL